MYLLDCDLRGPLAGYSMQGSLRDRIATANYSDPVRTSPCRHRSAFWMTGLLRAVNKNVVRGAARPQRTVRGEPR